MKLALIEPKPQFNSYFFFRKFPLLGNLILGTILKNAGHEVKVFKENFLPVYNEKNDELHPSIKEADVVGFTTITHTARRAYQIADAIKRQFPTKKVIFGGSHPSALPEEALEHADQVVVGEGEYVALDVFEAENNDKIVYGPSVNINDVPPIDLTLLQGYRFRNGKINMSNAPIMASRGCPYDCNFCSVTRVFGRKYKVKDAEYIMEEVMLRYREGFRHAFFYDDNFAAIPGKTKIFLEKLAKAGLDFNWSSQFRIEVAKDKEMLELLKRAGCTTLYVGVESINPDALQEYNKKETVHDIKNGITTLLDTGFYVHSMFILGADSDNVKTTEETIKFSKASNSSTAQYSILFPIPGTRLYDKMKEENRIFIDDWNYYDGSHSVIIPRHLTPIELQKKFFHGYKYFYRKNILYFLLSQVGFFLWKIHNHKYLRYIRYFSRRLNKDYVVKKKVATLKDINVKMFPYNTLSKAPRKK